MPLNVSQGQHDKILEVGGGEGREGGGTCYGVASYPGDDVHQAHENYINVIM